MYLILSLICLRQVDNPQCRTVFIRRNRGKKGKKIEIRKLYISYINNGDNCKETKTYFNGCHIYVAVIFGAISVAVGFTKN